MRKRPRERKKLALVDIVDNRWYPWKLKGDTHVCCKCGLEHHVEIRVVGGNQVWMRWVAIT